MEDNAAVEIHDSTLERIEHDGDDLVAVFSAYVHRSAGRPGVDAGSGWSQALHLRFRRGLASGNVEAVPMELLDGDLEVSGERFSNVTPMPLSSTGPISIELRGWNNTRIVIKAGAVEGTFAGQASYIEEFSSSDGSMK